MVAFREFMEFLCKQGVVGLAVGFVLGGVVSKVVTALVTDIINPRSDDRLFGHRIGGVLHYQASRH